MVFHLVCVGVWVKVCFQAQFDDERKAVSSARLGQDPAGDDPNPQLV